MSSADLRTWARNFEVLGGKLRNYEREAAQINPGSPNTGTGQLIGFQYGPCLDMLGLTPWEPKPSWMDEADFGPTEGNEHRLLASYYILSATLQFADAHPLEEARTSLLDLTARLGAVAARWAEEGVDADEVKQILDERRELAQRTAAAAAATRR